MCEKANTFEEANMTEPYDIISAFGIDSADSLCHDCIHYSDCRAVEVFEYYCPSDSISKCKFHVSDDVLDDIETELAQFKESCCDGVLWDEEPLVVNVVAHADWSSETWEKFDNLPVSHVSMIISKYGFLKERIGRDSKIADIYDYLNELRRKL